MIQIKKVVSGETGLLSAGSSDKTCFTSLSAPPKTSTRKPREGERYPKKIAAIIMAVNCAGSMLKKID
ncbi:MAG TPA: hypothetical protein VIP51_05075 [Eoetvoesiella sp.]